MYAQYNPSLKPLKLTAREHERVYKHKVTEFGLNSFRWWKCVNCGDKLTAEEEKALLVS